MTASGKLPGNLKSKLRWFPWIALAVVSGVVVAQKRAQSHSSGPIPSGVELTTVGLGTQQKKISATGIVASQTGTQVKIGSQIAGPIKSLPADVGTVVKANQVVAILELPDLQAQVDQMEHSVVASQAALEQATSRYKQAIETAGFNSKATAAQIAQADAALKAAEANVDSSNAANALQPIQTVTDIARAKAALSSARSAEKQEVQTVEQQIQQAQSNLDDAQAGLVTSSKTLNRQRELLKKGYIAEDLVDQQEAVYKQAVAKVQNMKAALDIAKEKTRADLQSAHDSVSQAEAALDAANAEKFQDKLHEATLRNAIETQKSANATLLLQQANLLQDKIKREAVIESHGAMMQAEAALKQAKDQLKYQVAQMDKTVIRSPIAGTVLSISSQQGETVAAGFSVTTLITVADLNRLEVRAYVDETDIGHIKLGLPCEVRVEAFPGKIFKGKVTKIASASTTKDNVVTYETTIAVTNTGGLLRPDMTADVSLILGEKPNVILVPSEAVHKEMRRNVVYVLHKEKPESDRVEVRAVETGFDDGTSTEIKSGVKVGESIVVAGLPRLGVRAPDSQGASR